MANNKGTGKENMPKATVASSIDHLLQKSLELGDSSLKTGRHIISFRETGFEEGHQSFKANGLQIADSRDFENQAFHITEVGDADAILFAELELMLVGEGAIEERGMSTQSLIAEAGPVQTIEPEYIVYSHNASYLRGFLSATQAIAADFEELSGQVDFNFQTTSQINTGVTWGIEACKVRQSSFSGKGIKVAILDTGLDLNHPDFQGRQITSMSFIDGEEVQDKNSHGTHCIGTACGPKKGVIQGTGKIRYGIAHEAHIFAGKVLGNDGYSAGGSVLNGINWAIANKCEVISLSLGSQTSVKAYYTQAGKAALNKGCLIIAAAGNDSSDTGAPANSPSIMSVSSINPFSNSERLSWFTNTGKIEITAPGAEVFSAWPSPKLHGIKSGTSQAAPHVAGCAALWAESNASLRGQKLWDVLQENATKARLGTLTEQEIGSGLVQAP